MKSIQPPLIAVATVFIFAGCAGSNKARNSNCKELNTGSYCFKNKTKGKVVVNLTCSAPSPKNQALYQSYNEPITSITLRRRQRQWFYNIPVGPATYDIKTPGSVTDRGYTAPNEYKANGNLYVDRCKKKKFVIK
jgi:hypothetical protein